MATFGSFPGVQITTTGGGISGVQVGDQEKLLIFGDADTSAGSASVNEPTTIGGRADADNKFGSNSQLSDAMKEALANGAEIDLLYGVALETQTATDEDVTGGGDAADHSTGSRISNSPIREDTQAITFEDDTGTVLDVAFKYETNLDDTSTDFTSLNPGTDTVFINPITGEWIADTADNYSITYDYNDWTTAFEADAVTNQVEEGETAIFAALTESEDVASTLSSTVTTFRNNYQMALGLAGARPGKTGSDGGAEMDPSNYTDAISNDAMFLIGPARRSGTHHTIIGGVGGMMAGHTIENPIYNDVLQGYTNLEQKLTGSEAQNLRDEKVIPVRQSGTIRVKDNLSTSDETDWERDFWRRRIVDRVILLTKQVGDATVGAINDERTRRSAETRLFAEIAELVNDRLLQPNTQTETNYFVDVYADETNADEVNIDVGITPYGIAKRIDTSITINT